MADVIEIRIDVLVNGKRHRLFPWHIRQSVDEIQEFDYDEPADNNDTTFSALPVTQVGTVQLLIVRAVDAVGLRTEGGEAGSAAIRLSDNGLALLMNAIVTNTNLTVNVNDSVDARIMGIGAGT